MNPSYNTTILLLLQFFLHFLHSHLWLRSFLNRRVYESSLSGLSPQNKIENSTINAPTIGRTSPIDRDMLCCCVIALLCCCVVGSDYIVD